MIIPPYSRQGNKMSILKELLPLLPQHTLYVELFTGSGALFFNKPLTKSILNDLDKDVAYRLNLLKKVPLFERKQITTTEQLKEIFKKPIKTLEDAVIHEKIKSKNGFNSNPVINPDKIYLGRSNPYSITNHLDTYKKLLNHATITNKDYKIILHKYDSPTTFFYLDPPYEKTDKGFYKNLTINYEEMRDILLKMKGYFLLSINDSPYIRDVFKNFIIKDINSLSTWNNKDNMNKKRKELLIMNYII